MSKIEEKIEKYLMSEKVRTDSKEIEDVLKKMYYNFLKTGFSHWKVDKTRLDKYFKMLSKNTDQKSLEKAVANLWEKLVPKRSRDDKTMFTFISFLEDEETYEAIHEFFTDKRMKNEIE